MPAKDNPVNDPTGEKCATAQNSSSPVFYLSFNNGGFSQRTCKVPAGKALFIPVLESEISQKESPKSITDQDLSKAAATDAGSANSLYLKIGDKEYTRQDLLKYRTHTDAFNLNFANNGIYYSRKIEVYTANDPVVALSEFKPNYYDLLLVDINMPRLNGFELCEKILAIDINVRICLMSSGEINWEALREIYPTRQEGCFIRKPVTMDYLLKRIRSELD